MEKNLVIVESPAKARTIGSYLGADYAVVASFGHVRDLPAKDGSVSPDENFKMLWEVDGASRKRLNEMADICKGSVNLFLATDPDREGEAIAWHVLEELEKRKALKSIKEVRRIVFHEITRSAIQTAIKAPRELNQPLIDAYMARRALDYLVGFTLSPVLWRKLPGARSAGRVQSVALRLVCDREAEIESFIEREYWSVNARLSDGNCVPFVAQLSSLLGKKLSKFDLADEQSAEVAYQTVLNANLKLEEVETKQQKRHPSPPFITASLQQEASRKLGFDAQHTMRVAQKLYEGIKIGSEVVGLISYMRTDSPQLSMDALNDLRNQLLKQYGHQYLPTKPRNFTTKSTNAQEAHEAIRPTASSRTPKDMASYLDKDQLKLYDLIWKRSMASQMMSADIERVQWQINAEDASCSLKASGSTVLFDGFMVLYTEGKDDSEIIRTDDQAENNNLPKLTSNTRLYLENAAKQQHFTQPAPRYNEASLVKKLEELSIGRPSTYATILNVLRTRGYAELDKRRFVPNMRGRLVTAFLVHFFEQWVDVNFTAGMEDKLDKIARGNVAWRSIMEEFWQGFKQRSDEALTLTRDEICKALDSALAIAIFGKDNDQEKIRLCPTCKQGHLSLNYGKWGAYLSCSQFPECTYSRKIDNEPFNASEEAEGVFPKELGVDPETSLKVSLRKGPYGLYLQLGETLVKEKGKKDKAAKDAKDAKDAKPTKPTKPKRVSIDKKINVDTIDLAFALKMLSLPRLIGTHPETHANIDTNIGRYGPYLHHQSVFVNLDSIEDVFTIGINRAVELIAQKAAKTAGKNLGEHPEHGGAIVLKAGRYNSHYVSHNKINATIPKAVDLDSITLDMAVGLLADRIAQAPKKAVRKKVKSTKKAKSTKPNARAKTKQ